MTGALHLYIEIKKSVQGSVLNFKHCHVHSISITLLTFILFHKPGKNAQMLARA